MSEMDESTLRIALVKHTRLFGMDYPEDLSSDARRILSRYPLLLRLVAELYKFGKFPSDLNTFDVMRKYYVRVLDVDAPESVMRENMLSHISQLFLERLKGGKCFTMILMREL